MTRSRIPAIAASGLLCIVAAPAAAQVPPLVGFQGRLLRADGTAASGTAGVAFSVFDAATGGSPLWTETQTLGLSDGYYSTLLGLVNAVPAGLFDGASRWLEIAVGGEVLAPRQRVGAAPFALAAQSVRGGTADVALLKVGGTTVVDAAGRLAGSARYAAGSGLALDGATQTFSLQACAAGQTLVSDATSWLCATGGAASMGAAWPLSVSGGSATPVIAMLQAASNASGYLSSADWSLFYSKYGSSTTCGGDLAGTLAAPVVARLQSRPVSAAAPQNGQVLKWSAASSQWEPSADADSPGTVTDVVVDAPLTAYNGSSTPHISLAAANASTDGFLGSADWARFDAKYGSESLCGGDLAGTFLSPQVAKLHGVAVSTAVPAAAQVLRFDGASWAPAALAVSDVGGLSSGYVALTGDQSVSGRKTFGTPPVFASALDVGSGGTGTATAGANTLFAGPASGSSAAPGFRTLVDADIPPLDAAKLTTGTLDAGRLSGTYPGALTFSNAQNQFAGNGSGLSSLSASSLASGTVPDARLAGTYGSALYFTSASNVFAGDGSALAGLNAGALSSGTLPDARLSGTYSGPLSFTNASNAYAGIFAGEVRVTGGVCDASHAGALRWTGAFLQGCDGTSWMSGLAGDVTGTQGATSVAKLQGRAMSAAAPAVGQLLRWDGAAWAPADQSAGSCATVGSTAPVSPSSGQMWYDPAVNVMRIWSGATQGWIAVPFDRPPTFTNGAASNGNISASYSFQFSASDPQSLAVTFSVVSGALPPGLTLSTGGLLSGVPTTPGTYAFTVAATDARGNASTQSVSIDIGAGDPQFTNTALLLAGDGANNAQNNTILDSSSNNAAVARNGNVTQGALNPFGSNWSTSFNGSGDYLVVPDNASLRFGTGDFTVEAWVFATRLNAENAIVTKHNGDGAWVFKVASSNKLYGYLGGASITGATTLVPNTWYHVAMTRASGVFRLFVNGALDATSTPAAQDYTQTNNVYVGAQQNNLAGTYWSGFLSNVRLVKGAALYTSAFTPSAAPMSAVSGTSLLVAGANRHVDASANALSVTPTGTPSVSRFSPFRPSGAWSAAANGGSLYLDGSGDWLDVPYSAAWDPGTSDFTIEAFVYLPVMPTANTYPQGYWLCGSGPFNQNPGFDMVIGSTNIELSISDYAAVNVNVAHGITAGTWNHVAFVRSGATNLYAYVNGTRVGSATVSASLASNIGGSALAVGRAEPSGGATGGTFNGYVSNFRLVKGSALYSGATYAVPTSPLTAVAGTQILLSGTNAGVMDGTAVGVAETVGTAKVVTATKKYGTGAMYFDGGSNCVTLPASGAYALGTGDFTVEFWMNWISGTDRGIFAVNSGSTNGINILVGASGPLRVYIGTNASPLLDSTISPTANTWQHVAVVRNAGTLTIYMDGQARGSANWSTANAGDLSTASVGAAFGNNRFFNGYLDDVRVTRGLARYTANFTPPVAAFPAQ